MSDSIFATPTPVTGNDFDGQSHAWGMKFTVSDDATCVGGRAWIPAAGRPTTFLWQIWRVGDATKIAESNLNAGGHGTPTAGAWYSFDSSLFSTPGDVSLDSAETYRVCVAFVGGDGVYTDNGSETFPTGTGVVSSDTGSFTNSGGTNVMPGTDYLAWFFADVTVESGAAASEVTLTPATVTLTPQAFTATPGVVAVALTSATASLAAQQFTATPGVVTVALTPAAVSLAARPFTATPGLVTVALTPAVMTLTPRAFSAGQTGVPTTWRVGPPELKWHAGPPELKWRVGAPEVG